MKFLAPLSFALLAACTTAPRQPAPPRQSIADFALEARFALRTETAGEKPQSANGRLSWTHRQQQDRILISTPLGGGIAELESTPGQATLILADGQRHFADDAEELLRQTTGHTLPVRQLPDWLRGRGSSHAIVATDPSGRPQTLREDNWQVQYSYDNEAPDAPPGRLTVRKGDELELRLRIEEWRSPP